MVCLRLRLPQLIRSVCYLSRVLPFSFFQYAYPVTSDGYDVYGEIGSGAFSTVYRGVVRDIGEEVAIKVIDLDLFNTNWEEIRREIQTLSQVRHDNVVKLKTAFVDGQDLWIVMSLLTAGSCAAVMKELGATNGIKDEVMIATILKEVLQALAYFHKHGSIHRDVKAGNGESERRMWRLGTRQQSVSNADNCSWWSRVSLFPSVLISGQGDVQLADFGVAGTLMEGGDRKKNRQTFTGTPCWMVRHTRAHDTAACMRAATASQLVTILDTLWWQRSLTTRISFSNPTRACAVLRIYSHSLRSDHSPLSGARGDGAHGERGLR